MARQGSFCELLLTFLADQFFCNYFLKFILRAAVIELLLVNGVSDPFGVATALPDAALWKCPR